MVNIFEQGVEMKAGWAKFENIGDKVQGTYVGKKKAVSKFGPQIVYELMDEIGNITLVGIRESDEAFHNFMKLVRMGQIIGIEYKENINTGKGNPYHRLVIIHNPKIVNEEWLNAQKSVVNEQPLETISAQYQEVENDPNDPIFGTPVQEKTPFDDDEDKIKKIGELAGKKFGTTDAMDIRNKVMEFTGLAFISANLDAIIEKLSV